MSAEQSYETALEAALSSVEGLNGVSIGAPARASAPWAEVGEMLSFDWSTKDAAGRELRTTVLIRDRGVQPGRLHGLAASADAAVQAIARDLDGWRIASVMLARMRILRDDAGWMAMIEHRVRLLQS